MTEEQKKELLSTYFISMIGSYSGFKCEKTNPDNGVDLLVTKVINRNENLSNLDDRKRLLDNSNILRFQLKATSYKSITKDKNIIKYDLKSSNYNDLVFQRKGECANPLILILCILPDSFESWLHLTDNSLITFSEAYYYMAEPDAERVEREDTTKRIEIKTANRITMESMNNIYKEVFENER